MATKDVRELNATTYDILNAIRNNASANYRDYVPEANPNQNNIREIGSIIMNYQALQNEFLSALINRIGLVMITSKGYTNPWSMFKKGKLDYGESVEEVFVNLANPFKYDPAVAESEIFKREIPDVRAAFHYLNYQTFYKDTIQQKDLELAFLGIEGVRDLITKIIDSMFAAENYDEFNVMKYLLARNILNGRLTPVQIAPISAQNAKSIVSTIKGKSNDMTFMNRKYTPTGVATHTQKADQFLIVNSEFDSVMDVEVLASAFNMDKAQFDGQRVLVDSFGELDTDRLQALLGDEYVELTEAQITALNGIPAVLVDREWFMIFDKVKYFTDQFNGQGLYWNYWYHVWKIFSSSPFKNAIVFAVGAPAVSSVALSPTEVTVQAGQSVILTPTVVTNYFASKAVTYTITVDGEDTELASVSVLGEVTISAEATSGTVFTVTATSVVDSTKTATCTITVA